uniref:DZIP3-like HEPN domain-containing protein n=1 Tax=Magallana gigas TaxID=29159 RepID=A0A8W8NWI5_MAGGI
MLKARGLECQKNKWYRDLQMMANSKYASTRETTNLARVARIILGPCTDVLCDVLKKEIPPLTLSQKVKTYLANLPKRKHPPITKEQERIIHNGNYSDFDITLLFFLLRNISNISPHAKQWGNEPILSDRSVSANIERIRLIRNKYGHCTEISISDTDFNKKVLEISSVIQDLEKYLGTSTVYQDAVVEIGNCCMDPEQETKYIKELLDLNKQIKGISEKTTLIENRCVPENVTVLYKRDSLRWENDDRVFLETHNFPVMLDQVRNQPYITFVGAPGSGKTAMARHIALKLQKEGYEICPVKEINKIEDYCNRNIPQVFVIDDVLGIFGLNEHELHMINKYSEILRDPINPKTKTLMTCREAVFKNEMISECILVKLENVVNLQSRENSLNNDDKQNLLQVYNLDRDLLSSRNLASSSRMFPFLCKLYSNKKELEFYGPTFFLSPVPCIIKEMDSLKIHNKLHYASLVLLMINRNRLSENILNNENDGTIENQKRNNLFVEMKRNILRKCKVVSTTESFDLIDALLQMEGTYTKKNGNEFTFIHDSMFEIIAYHFGHQFPELILKYASSDYIANNIKIDQHTSQKGQIKIEGENVTFSEKNHENEDIIDLCIHLHESQNQMLAERLFKDVQNGEFYKVFGNESLKSQSLLQCFIAVLEKHSYYNLHSLLLTESEDSKLCTWNDKIKYPLNENIRSMALRCEAHFCVMNERLIGFHKHIRSKDTLLLIKIVKQMVMHSWMLLLIHITNQ